MKGSKMRSTWEYMKKGTQSIPNANAFYKGGSAPNSIVFNFKNYDLNGPSEVSNVSSDTETLTNPDSFSEKINHLNALKSIEQTQPSKQMLVYPGRVSGPEIERYNVAIFDNGAGLLYPVTESPDTFLKTKPIGVSAFDTISDACSFLEQHRRLEQRLETKDDERKTDEHGTKENHLVIKALTCGVNIRRSCASFAGYSILFTDGSVQESCNIADVSAKKTESLENIALEEAILKIYKAALKAHSSKLNDFPKYQLYSRISKQFLTKLENYKHSLQKSSASDLQIFKKFAYIQQFYQTHSQVFNGFQFELLHPDTLPHAERSQIFAYAEKLATMAALEGQPMDYQSSILTDFD